MISSGVGGNWGRFFFGGGGGWGRGWGSSYCVRNLKVTEIPSLMAGW